jgi:hypothetical protein
MINLLCCILSLVAVVSGLLWMVPAKKRKPQACQYFGRLTFLTVQSNILLTLYHALRHVRPESYIAVHAYPYAFAAGVGLTINYYGLDHFLPEKIAEDKRWIAKGYAMIPVANHLEHGLALPTALLDAFYGGHAGQCSMRDVLVFVGGYTTFYNLFQLVNKRLTGAWLYPVFYEAEAAVGPRWAFWAVATPVSLFYCGLGALALAMAR